MTGEDGRVVVAGGRGAAIDPRDLRKVRGAPWGTMDLRFSAVVLVSLLLHAGGLYYVHRLRLPPPPEVMLEKIPERFARLIVEKPIPKARDAGKPAVQEKGKAAPAEPAKAQPEAASSVKESAPQITQAQRARAQKSVAAHAASVENKIRTVGVLGMLSGVGATAKGPSVVDVLGAVGKGKERQQDLEKALGNMTGLQKAGDVAFVERKLVKSKEVTITATESIDNLIEGIGAAKTSDLAKQGAIVIQKPESIEGAASASAKRDSKAINDVVLTHKASIRMSYEKFLKRDPALAGKITLRFTIGADGHVSKVEVLENSTGNEELEREIVRKVSMWVFEPVPEGDASVTYPFLFRPS